MHEASASTRPSHASSGSWRTWCSRPPAAGTLGHTVIVHGGTNGPIDEAALRRLLDNTRDRRVYLVNVHVPRTWEGFNDELFARVAPEYPNVHVLDWAALATANRPWLYTDDIHLRPGGRT